MRLLGAENFYGEKPNHCLADTQIQTEIHADSHKNKAFFFLKANYKKKKSYSEDHHKLKGHDHEILLTHIQQDQ